MTLDVAEVKRAAAGRWADAIISLSQGKVTPEMLNGNHGPCPLCGGRDRFRALDDFQRSGALFCNACFSRHNGDGIAALQWLRGERLPEVVQALGDYLGIKPSRNGNGRPRKTRTSNNSRSKGRMLDARPQGKAEQPEAGPQSAAAGLEAPGDSGSKAKLFAEVHFFNDLLAGCYQDELAAWCEARKPITVESVKRLGGRLCRWKKGGFLCIGFEGRNLHGTTKAILLYRLDGRLFPKAGNLPERKTHLVKGSAESWVFPGDPTELKTAETIVKAEGVTDAAALLSTGLPPGWIVTTNACGAKSSNPKKLDFSFAEGKAVVLVADADAPGQEGGQRFAASFHQAGAAEIKLVTPPGFSVTEDSGADIRDWLAQGHDAADFLELVSGTPAVTEDDLAAWGEPKSKAENEGKIAGNDDDTPERISNAAGVDEEMIPLPMVSVLARIKANTDDFPRRIGNSLFIHKEGDPDVHFLPDSSALFGWLQSRVGVIEWHRIKGSVTKAEVFAELARTATAYQAIEYLPHWPKLESHFYTCAVPSAGDGSAVNKLLDYFSLETPLDRSLLLTAFATPLWGGPSGRRPAFLFTAKAGRGIGKSTAAQLIGLLWGGVIDFSLGSKIDDIKTRLLSAEGMRKRICLLDNLKTLKLSSAELESLVTADEISGHRMYAGEGSRPNFLVWFLTLNGPSLSSDFAERVVEIRFRRPEYDGNWEADVRGFIEEKRQQIIGDLISILQSDPQTIEKRSRWASWESDILARVPHAADCFDLIATRRGELDAEKEEGETIEDFFAEKLAWLDYDPGTVDVFIPTKIVTRWVNEATNENRKTVGTTTYLKQMKNEGKIWRIVYDRSGPDGKRGFRWIGERASVDDGTRHDLAKRVAKKLDKQHSSEDSEDGTRIF